MRGIVLAITRFLLRWRNSYVPRPRVPAGFAKPNLLAALAGWALLTVASVPAAAQIAGRSLADAAEQDSVGARSKSNYDADGIPVGAFRLYASAEGRIGYDSNVYNTDEMLKSDSVMSIDPRLELRSGSPTYSVALNANGSIRRYGKLKAENSEQYAMSADGGLSIGKSARVAASAFFGRYTELRGTLGDVLAGGTPLEYERSGGTASVALDFNKLIVAASTGVETLDFDNTRLGDVVVLQDYRDRRVYLSTVRISLQAWPGFRLFSQGEYNRQDYRNRLGDINQNSDGYSIAGGVSFGLTELISGEVSAGYLKQTYKQGRIIDGLTYKGKIVWNPTSLLTATLTGSRTLEQSPFFAQAGVIQDNLALKLDHELLRNLIISTSGRATFNKYHGMDRRDRFYEGEVAARLLISRNLEANLRVNHRHQRSTGFQARPFTGTSVAFGVIVKR